MQYTSKKSTFQKLGQTVLVAAVLCIFAKTGQAQSGSRGYGQTLSNNIISNNSASRFSAQALRSNLTNRSTSSVGVAGVNSRNFLSNSASPLTRPTKPFAGATNRPTVSPYLALSSPRSSASDYYNIVRPQQQRQRQNQRQQAFTIQRQKRLNQMAARAPYSVKGDAQRMGTGHVAVFQSIGSYQNTSSYFPPPSRPKRRR